ncbi:predicted protein [Nematostella vectensis]|uniref:G-protein coupled receptors family 1 profile domain-containing protein n=1 Tax=Nematostella vectensis TaxID=45351 RepID=A7RX80_NEMVE|nr:trace amine-associated receptor 1 [Nematostella vectensis]XP_032241632.1 trace amine-associated receptor 1 [Nematostella vectensis]XP_032241633.1 trace amine-associated receptor 1 [Nematostella vectensis]XP_048586792.1 trace amine-associated receptor 1 [Nematostella vectensis]XP_048586793.1 trace amine-associated receptor 1 [Nematostella vectensis]EDO43916.1 predicted protein [Nematostella vectensis]|eukprot:XP_001635979.1 predicted protein [Nematostella vectensis]
MSEMNGTELSMEKNGTTGNGSSFNPIFPPMARDYTSLTYLVPLILLITLVNGLVFVLFALRKPIRTPANYLLLSLAVSDFLTGLVNVPLIITVIIPVYGLMRGLMPAMHTFVKLTAILTSYHILAVTVEKYLAIVKPLRHHIANPSKAFKVILAIWLISSLIAVAPISWMLLLPQTLEARLTGIRLQFGHDVFCFVAVFLIPYVIITYCQTVMFRAVSRSNNKALLGRTKSSRKSDKWSNDRKCLVVFAIMALLFALCWLPWFLLSSLATLSVLFPQAGMAPNVPITVFMSFLIVRLLTSVFNPLLYTFFKRDFMLALKSVVTQKKNVNDTRILSCSTNIVQKNNAGKRKSFGMKPKIRVVRDEVSSTEDGRYLGTNI